MARRLFARVAAVAVAGTLLVPAVCAADPFVPPSVSILGGVAIETSPANLVTQFDVFGDGFAVTGSWTSGFSTAIEEHPHTAGEVIDLGSSLATPFGGTIVFQGNSYAITADPSVGRAVFSTPTVTLPTSAAVADFRVPFSFAGTLGFVRTPTDRLELALSGSGIATARAVLEPGTHLYDINQVTYAFSRGSVSPTPEPAPFVLLAVGALAFVVRRLPRPA